MEPRYDHDTGHQPMISMRNVVVTGGNFAQHIAGHDRKPPFEILQENVAHTAFHNAGDRFDLPKCHPNTRQAVLKKIMDWMCRKDQKTWYRYIMWLTGAAGAGKSAIAQSIIELCLVEGLIIASFFFFRSDPTRNHGKSLGATLAYQIFFSVPTTQKYILLAIYNDPLIFTRSLSHQFDRLVIQPLRKFYAPLDTLKKKCRRLIVIDGLDECLDRDTQKEILTMLRDAIRKYELPVIFLVASRPEHDITTVFNSKPMDSVFFRLYLDDKFSPDNDIRIFLRDGFQEIKTTHPFKAYIPVSWPSDDTLKEIIRKSSGQFIYAATVLRYAQSIRHRPDHRLDVVNNLRPAQGDLPFAQLDALYKMILGSVADRARVLYMLSIFSHCVGRSNLDAFDISSLMSLQPGDLEILGCDLGAIISINKTFSFCFEREVVYVKILHTSLHDFLLDPMRSGDCFLDIDTYRSEHVANIIQYLIKDRRRNKFRAIENFIKREFPLCQSSASLINIAENFSILDLISEEIEAHKEDIIYNMEFMDLRKFVFWFWLPFCARMAPLDDRWAVIEKKHQEYVEQIFLNELPHYYEDDEGVLLLCVTSHLGSDMCVPSFPADPPSFARRKSYDMLYLFESFALEEGKAHHLRHFTRFLQHPEQSDKYPIGPSAYAKAALHCIKRHPFCLHQEEDRMLNTLTFDNGKWTSNDTTTYYDRRMDFLLLGYIVFFLPRAGFSKQLVEECEEKTRKPFGLIINGSLRRGALIRQEMKNYLDRVRS